jgi:archaellum biogenesis protein FlaJ (TadC family)
LEPQWRLSVADVVTSGTAAEQGVLKQGELFIVARVLNSLREVFPHFRNLMTSATVAILLTLLAMSSYPFAQRDTLLTFAWIIVLGAVGAMSYVFVTMNRDRLLSLLSGTTPGQLTLNGTLIAQLLTYAVLPLLALPGVQFLGQFGSMVSWFSKLAGGHPG